VDDYLNFGVNIVMNSKYTNYKL